MNDAIYLYLLWRDLDAFRPYLSIFMCACMEAHAVPHGEVPPGIYSVPG